MSQKPIPPFFLGVHNFFQLIQWIFFLSFVCPHQYFANVEFMESHSALGILNIPIGYVKIAWATVFIRISLLALEIYFSFHPNTLFVIFSPKSLKVLTFDFPPTIGRPKYFSRFSMILALLIPCIATLTSVFVFQLKNNVVFYLLIAWPDACSYQLNNSRRCWHSPSVAWQKIKLSSAKRRCEIHTPFVQDNIPCRFWEATAWRIKEDSPSAHNRNM